MDLGSWKTAGVQYEVERLCESLGLSPVKMLWRQEFSTKEEERIRKVSFGIIMNLIYAVV